MEAVAFDSEWQREKIPQGVLVIIMTHLLERRCGVCGRFYIYESKNESMRAFAQTCQRWRRCWLVWVKQILKLTPFPLCAYPKNCLNDYARSVPPLPFLLVGKDLEKWRKTKNTEK